MRITSVEAFVIQAKWRDKQPYWGARAWGAANKASRVELSVQYPPPQRRQFIYSESLDTVVVKLTTNDGLIGYGEAKAPVAPQATKQVIDLLLANILLGANPLDATVLWERMYAGMRVRGHRAGFYLEAISGVDIALWDLIGKSMKLPIYQLLGGAFRNPVPIYASGLPALSIQESDESFARLSEEAESIHRQGYNALKMGLGRGIAGDVKSVGTVREQLGCDFIIFADAAGAYDRAQAMRLGKELESLGVAWLEMPIFPEDVEGYAELAKALTIPIALDSLSSRYEALEFIRRGGLDVVQPDVCRAGGITECRRIAELADAFGVALAPHVSIGSAIHFAASAHLAAAMPNTMICEYWIGDNPLSETLVEKPLLPEKGCLQAPSGPGLGLQIKEEALRASGSADGQPLPP